VNQNASTQVAAEAPGPRPILRVLSGLNAGAQCDLHEDRVLVGNIEGECDIVLDVTRPERHACLVRASSDGWTVLAIAGDLWVEREYVPPQHTCPIAPGLVITIGRVSFGVGHAELVDWNSLAPPADLQRPTADGALPHAVTAGRAAMGPRSGADLPPGKTGPRTARGLCAEPGTVDGAGRSAAGAEREPSR